MSVRLNQHKVLLESVRTRTAFVDGVTIALKHVAQDLVRNDVYTKHSSIQTAFGEQILGPGTPFNLTVFISFPTSASTMLLGSNSTEDAVGGTGCDDILVIGLDSNRDELCEVVTLTGTTTVTTAGVFRFINETACLTSGSSRSNVGTITITDSSDTIVLGIPQLRCYNSTGPTDGFSKSSVFSVPNGKLMLNTGIEINSTMRGADNHIILKLKFDGDIVDEISDEFYVNQQFNANLRSSRARLDTQNMWLTTKPAKNNVELHVKMSTIIADARGPANFT